MRARHARHLARQLNASFLTAYRMPLESGRLLLILRFPAPDRSRSRVEQAILRRYLASQAASEP
jgi:hypothetical protein